MRYALILAGLGGISGGLSFANNAVGVDALTASTLFIAGVAALSAGMAACDIIAELKGRGGAPGRAETNNPRSTDITALKDRARGS